MARQIESKTIFSAVDRISPVTAKIAKSMTPLANQLSRVGKSLQGFGTNAMLKSGVGLTGMFYGLAKPAMAFEKSMANVFKVFDPTKINISQKSFSKTVRNMSSNMGIMATQMADIFENMPLPEILNIDNMSITEKYKGIMNMAEMTAMALTTMGLEAGDAGEKMKSMFNVMGGKDINKVIQTMNAVNEMGNQFGVKPADTLEFLTRQGGLGLGNTAKLSNLQTTAIGSTMLGFGATPETAKTSFQKMINVGQTYTSATKKQIDAFRKLGTNAENFAKSWQASPTDAIIDILNRAKSLKDIEVTPVFKELFGIEGSVNIKTFMLNLDGFSKKLKLMNDEQAINNSVFKEFSKLNKTSSFAVDKLKSSLNNLGIILGNALLPHITKISDKISEWTNKYEKLTPATKKMIGDFAILSAGLLTLGFAVGGVSYALGGLAIAMGTVTKAGKLMSGVDMLGMGGIGGAFSKSNDNLKKLQDRKNATGWTFKGRSKFNKANLTEKIFGRGTRDISSASFAVSKMVGIVGMAITSFEVLTATASAIALPFLPLIGILGAVSAVVYTIYNRWDKFKGKFEEIGNAFKFLASTVGIETDNIGSKFKGFGDLISKYISRPLSFVLNRIKEAIIGMATLINITKYGFTEGIRRTQNIQASMELKGKDKKYADMTGEFSPNEMKLKSGMKYDPNNPLYLKYLKNKNDNMKIVVEVLGDKNAKVSTNLNGKNINQSMSTGITSTPTLNYSPINRGK